MKEGIKSFGWNGFSQAYRVIFSSVVLIFLARIVSVEDFGIIGMSAVFVIFFNMLLNIGLDTSLIHSKTSNEHHLFTLFVFSIGVGIFLTLIGYVAAPLIGLFYENEETGVVFRALTFSVFFASIGLIPKGFLQKELQFKKIAIIDLIGITIAGIVAIVMAQNEYGYWALVAQQLLTVLLASLGYLIAQWTKIFKTLVFYKSIIVEHLRFGYNVLLFNTVNFFAQQLDVLLIGKFLGETETGIYTLAFNLAVKPINLLIQVFNRTIFPFLTKIQLTRVPKVYSSYTTLFFYVFAPLIVLGVSLSQILIPIVLDEKWLLTLPLIFVFGFQAIRGLISSPSGVLFLVAGQPQKQWRFSLFISLPFRILGILLGFYAIEHSALGVSIGFNISATIEMCIGFWITFKLVKLGIAQYFKSFVPIVFSLILLSLVLLAVHIFITHPWLSIMLQLCIFVGLIAVNYYYNTNVKLLLAQIKEDASDEG